jgi:YidC/Oxa1 family membrane protein insertase
MLGQTRLSRTLQALQPQLQSLQQRYTNDPVQLNQGTMALYQQAGVNPLSGCFWSIIQMVIHLVVSIGLYQTVRGLGDQQDGFLWLPDLSLPSGWPIPAPQLAYLSLSILLVIVQLINLRVVFASGANQSLPGGQVGVSLGPWLFGVIAVLSPSGLVLFWLIISLFDLIYQAIIAKAISSDKILATVILLVLLAPAIGGGIWLYIILGSIWLSLYMMVALLSFVFVYLGCLVAQPYKLQYGFYYFFHNLSAYLALYLAYRRYGDSWLTPLTAITSFLLFTWLYARLMQQLAPKLTLKARIAFQSYFGVDVNAKRQQLAVLEQGRFRQEPQKPKLVIILEGKMSSRPMKVIQEEPKAFQYSIIPILLVYQLSILKCFLAVNKFYRKSLI